MTPREARIAVDVYTGIAVASVGLALAGLTWRLTGEPGVAPAAAPAAARGGEVIDIGPVIALAPFGTAVTPVSADQSPLKLRAIFMAVPASASAALFEAPDGKVASYGVGAAVGGGVIQSIESNQVIVRTPSGLQAISFNQPGQSGAAGGSAFPPSIGAPPAASQALPAGIAPTSAAAPQPSGAELPGLHRGNAGAAAESGYRVGATPAPELLAGGIRPGDVVLSVNGTALGSASSEREIMGKAIGAGSAQVELIRDGRRVSLSVPLR